MTWQSTPGRVGQENHNLRKRHLNLKFTAAPRSIENEQQLPGQTPGEEEDMVSVYPQKQDSARKVNYWLGSHTDGPGDDHAD